MTTRRNFLKSGGLSLAGLLVGQKSFAHLTESATPGAPLVSNTVFVAGIFPGVMGIVRHCSDIFIIVVGYTGRTSRV